MPALPNSLNVALELLVEGRFIEIGKRCAGLVYNKRVAYGLRRDLQIPLVAPKAKIPLSIRELREGDLPALFPDDRSSLSRKEKVELRTRRAHYEAAMQTCYVAIDDNNSTPCYFQWLMGPEENNKIQSFFPDKWFPVLKDDEALLENAYTPPAYRGKGVMSAAMALIAERAALLGRRYVVTFVASDNIPSLRGCKNAGFSPYMLRTERSMLCNTIKVRHFGPLVNNEIVPGADKLNKVVSGL